MTFLVLYLGTMRKGEVKGSNRLGHNIGKEDIKLRLHGLNHPFYKVIEDFIRCVKNSHSQSVENVGCKSMPSSLVLSFLRASVSGKVQVRKCAAPIPLPVGTV
jgi:hypothetical protein